MSTAHCFTTQEEFSSELQTHHLKRYEKKVENLNMPKSLYFNPLVHYISTKVVTSFHRRVVPNTASDHFSIRITHTLTCMQSSDITWKKEALLNQLRRY